jgi:hypothetical protein
MFIFEPPDEAKSGGLLRERRRNGFKKKTAHAAILWGEDGSGVRPYQVKG